MVVVFTGVFESKCVCMCFRYVVWVSFLSSCIVFRLVFVLQILQVPVDVRKKAENYGSFCNFAGLVVLHCVYFLMLCISIACIYVCNVM